MSLPTIRLRKSRTMCARFLQKVDSLAASETPKLSALEDRIDILAAALNASAEAGQAVPRELEKLLSGLVEKLEWVQLGPHGSHRARAS